MNYNSDLRELFALHYEYKKRKRETFRSVIMQQSEINNWNSLFPNAPIRPDDLKFPTEYFLTHVLIAYLRKFGYKVEEPTQINNNDSKEYRAFLIKLSRHTDYMLKICRKTLSFTYYDLISPTPRKTSQTLSILLNYLIFFNYFKDGLLNKVKGQFDECEELKLQIEQNKCANEHLKEINIGLRHSIKTLEEELSNGQSEYDILVEKVGTEKKRKEQLKEIVTELTEKVQELKYRNELLSRSVVTDEESKKLQGELDRLKNEMCSIEKQENQYQADLIERDDIIKVHQELSKDILKAYDILPKCLIEKWKQCDELLRKVFRENEQINMEHAEIKNDKEELKQKIQTFKLLAESKKNKMEVERKERTERIEEQQRQLDEQNATKKILEEKSDELDELRDIEEYLKGNIKKIRGSFI